MSANAYTTAWQQAMDEWGDGPRTMYYTAAWANRWFHNLRTDHERLMITLTARDAELAELRKELWLRHGHYGPMLYGDDGELQCHVCGLDFKRDSVARIVEVLHFSDMVRASSAHKEQGDLASLRLRYREAEDRIAALEEALYPLVVGCYEADAREDAPEFVNGEGYNGARALPQCERCDTTGATDKKHYEDMPIPSEVVCPDCGGWGFLKHPIALKEGQS